MTERIINSDEEHLKLPERYSRDLFSILNKLSQSLLCLDSQTGSDEIKIDKYQLHYMTSLLLAFFLPLVMSLTILGVISVWKCDCFAACTGKEAYIKTFDNVVYNFSMMSYSMNDSAFVNWSVKACTCMFRPLRICCPVSHHQMMPSLLNKRWERGECGRTSSPVIWLLYTLLKCLPSALKSKWTVKVTWRTQPSSREIEKNDDVPGVLLPLPVLQR